MAKSAQRKIEVPRGSDCDYTSPELRERMCVVREWHAPVLSLSLRLPGTDN